jgi:type II secretory pathway pseudopilin PulG
MTSGRRSSGFTIVETLIFLAVTSALLVSGLLLVSGQERKTRFTQSLNDIREQVDSVINNVSTGYYDAGEQKFSCNTAISGPPTISSAAAGDRRGRNERCIYIGRAMQFKPDGKDNEFKIYTIVGRQYANGSLSKNVEELAPPNGAWPTPIDTPLNEVVETNILGAGIKPVAMRYNGSNITGIFAVISDFGKNDGSGNLTTSSRTASLYGFAGTDLGTSSTVALSNYLRSDSGPFDYVEATSGVAICFESQGTDQYGILTIGGSNRQLTTDIKIVNKNAPAADKVPCP